MTRCAIPFCPNEKPGADALALCAAHWRVAPHWMRVSFQRRDERGDAQAAWSMFQIIAQRIVLIEAGNDGEFRDRACTR